LKFYQSFGVIRCHPSRRATSVIRGHPWSIGHPALSASRCHPASGSSVSKCYQNYPASYTRRDWGGRDPTMSCSEADNQFGEVEEEMQSTDRQEEELLEWSNARTTVTGAVVSTVHLGRSRESADASIRVSVEGETSRSRAWDLAPVDLVVDKRRRARTWKHSLAMTVCDRGNLCRRSIRPV